jgi:hypothetical protein
MRSEPMGKTVVSDYEPLAGDNIAETARALIAMAKKEKRACRADFNGIDVKEVK